MIVARPYGPVPTGASLLCNHDLMHKAIYWVFTQLITMQCHWQ